MLCNKAEKGVARRACFRTEPGGQKAVSIVEFVVVLPLLVLFFIGIFELGRKLGQINWLSQTTFNAAYVGAGAPGGEVSRVEDTKKLAAELFFASRYGEFKSAPDFTPTFVVSFDDQKDYVAVQFQGDLRPLLSAVFGLNVQVASYLPYLGPGEIKYSGEFENPATHYCSQPPPSGGGGSCPIGTPTANCTVLPLACSQVTGVPTFGPPFFNTVPGPGPGGSSVPGSKD